MKHTKLPWSIWSEGTDINPSVTVESESVSKFIFQTVGSNDQANAAFIVKAVNSHEMLVEIAQMVSSGNFNQKECIDLARKALTQAESK